MPEKNMETSPVYSQLTMCLHCHLTVTLVHYSDADPVKGAWQCPTPGCGHLYPFRFWKIKKKKEKLSPTSKALHQPTN